MSAQHISSPPLDGSIPVLPGFVDFHAKHNPDLPWAVYPSGSSRASISFREYADATHRAAHAFRPDKTHANGKVVAVIIHTDNILYLAILVGLVRAGYTPFLMAPRCSVAAFVHLLEKTSCHHIITQPAFSSLVDSIKSELDRKKYELLIEQIPSLGQVFPGISGAVEVPPVEPFPLASKNPDPEDIVVYLHSSGSTGLPKHVPQRQKTLLQWCSSSSMVETRKRGLIWGAMALPTFHTIGIYLQICAPLSSGNPIGLYAPVDPAPPPVATPTNLLEACQATAVNCVTILPAFIETWSQSDEHVKYLSTLKVLAFSGGPLSERNGNKLVEAGVPLQVVYGGTEFGVHSRLFGGDDSRGPSTEWQWVAFPDYLNCKWVAQGDGTFELHFLRCDGHWPSVENLSETRGYATSDLFTPHPTTPGLWKVTGRKDDVLVLGTGEKVVPIAQEGMVASDPMVAGVVLFGRGHMGCGLLIEPRPAHAIDPKDPEALAAFRQKIWPIVEEANRVAPTETAHIYKDMIIVVDPAKPLPRAAKGTVIRPQAMKAYEEEIENLYQAIATNADSKGVPPPASWSTPDIEPWLMKHCVAIEDGLVPTSGEVRFDFKSASRALPVMHATFLRHRIVGTLKASPEVSVRQAATRISDNFIYDHPTLHEMAGAIAVLAGGSS